jgi:hypothetical protein
VVEKADGYFNPASDIMEGARQAPSQDGAQQ